MSLPRKRFGQHFLCDPAYIAQIVEALHPNPDDNLVEIGPGQGALTVSILKAAGKLTAIELDRDLIPALKTRCQRAGELQVYSADALSFDFSQLKTDARKLRIFGNLPYNISTPLLFHLLDYTDIISDMMFMLQKEVGHRLAGKPNDEHYGRLSVMLQYHCQVELLFDVPNFAFYPPPQVQSSIVRLTPHAKFNLSKAQYKIFADIVRQSFGQRRKTLRNSLKDLISDDDWAHLQIHSDMRPENLSVTDFVALAKSKSG